MMMMMTLESGNLFSGSWFIIVINLLLLLHRIEIAKIQGQIDKNANFNTFMVLVELKNSAGNPEI